MESIQPSVLGTWKIRHNFHSVIGLFVMALLLAAVYLTGDTRWTVVEEEDQTIKENSLPRCDFFSGKWVYDNESYPPYKEQECSFMINDYACEKYGRKETKYQHWRWKPHDCDLPRFNGTALLEKLRGKRVIFVGDSLNKNQWISLLCLLESSIPPSQRFSRWHGSLITFNTSEYNVSIDFYWEPMVVESNCDDPINHHVQDRIIKVQNIEKHARQWTDADILVFDSFMWWLSPNMTLVWRSSDQGSDEIYEVGRLGRVRSYEMALKTWSDWLKMHINRTKTQLFFMSLSPYHQMGEDWGKGANTNCYNETEPILEEGFWGRGSERGMMQVAEEAVQELERRGLKVQYLNITQLSNYRKEAHPSIYRKHWKPPTEGEELSNPSSYSDCVHWCLPGVPDVWNQLLYAYISHYS